MAYMVARPAKARAMVAWSEYSSSPPTGSPVAIRDTWMPSGLIQVRFFKMFDKFQHFTAFLGLAVLLCAVWTSLGASTSRMLRAVLLILAAYGILDELTQSFIPGRTPDLYDWAADMLGSIAGAGAFAILRETFRGQDSAVTS